MQCLACHQARHKLSTKGLENYRTHQKCTNEQKIGSLAVFKADPWRLLYSEAAADFALPKTTWNIFTPLWGDTWMGRNPHHQAVLMAWGTARRCISRPCSGAANSSGFQSTSDPLSVRAASFREIPSLQVISKCLSTALQKCLPSPTIFLLTSKYTLYAPL